MAGIGQQGLQTVQDFDVLILEGVFFLCTLLRVLRQGVSSSIGFALSIIDSKVVTKEFLSPANLSGAQTLCIHEPAKVVVVGKYKNFMLRAI